MCNITHIRKNKFDEDILNVVSSFRHRLQTAEHNHFSVFVLKTAILTVSHNCHTGCSYSPSVHSEIHGIGKLARLNRYKRMIQKNDVLDVYNVRMNKSGKIGNSRPCKNCILTMSKNGQFKFGKVYYTNTEGEFTCEKFSSMLDNPDTTVSSGNRRREFLRELIRTKTLTAENVNQIMYKLGFSKNSKSWIGSLLKKSGVYHHVIIFVE